jgi:sulfatase modifying factor 1
MITPGKPHNRIEPARMKHKVVIAVSLLMGCSTFKGELHTSFRDCGYCPEMTTIVAEPFMMGSTGNALEEAGVLEPFASFQTPAHWVALNHTFAIGKYPITKLEFSRFAQATKRPLAGSCWSWNIPAGRYELQEQMSWRDPGFPQTKHHPVVCVNWDDAQAYVEWLADVTGQPYRLITEAEREYATRAGTTTPWPWGTETDAVCQQANVSDLSRLAVHTATKRSPTTVFDCEDGFVYTAPVGSFAANRFGLHDTLGNVWEWVEDCFQESYATAPAAGHAAPSTDCQQRTLRGGSWFTLTFLNRPAARYGTQPSDRSGHVGFRVARTMD